jgi:uncharacterized membrane protein YphA (DoxX/SURF4 family)
MFVFMRQYGWIALLLLVAEGVFLHYTDSRWLFTFLFYAPEEIFQQNYPRFWWLVYGVVKGQVWVLVGVALYYVMQLKQAAINLMGELRHYISAQAAALRMYFQRIDGYKPLSLGLQISISVFLFAVFSAGYYVLQHLEQDKDAFFETQLKSTYVLLAALCVQLLIAVYRSRFKVKEQIERILVKNGTAYNLAIFRIVIGFQLWGIYSFNHAERSYFAAFPQEMRVSLPGMGWFIHHVPISPTLYELACYGGIAASLLIMVGLFTRWALWINVPLSIYIRSAHVFRKVVARSYLGMVSDYFSI